jgi:hypothetical protein
MLRCVLASSLAMTFAGHASARPWVPGELQKLLDMPCAPPCTLCHDVPQGGGPADKPFGNAIQTAGFFPTASESADSDTALKNALSVLEGATIGADGGLMAAAPGAKPTDSDNDGVPDVTELRNGSDPDGSGSVCGPTYGCVRVSPGNHVDGVGVVASAATLLVGIGLLRRKRR